MKILFGCFIGICFTLAACLSWQKYELFYIKRIKEKRELFLLSATFLIAGGMEVFLAYQEYHWITWLKISFLLAILIICSYIDLEKRIIPNKILIMILPAKLIISFIEYFVLPETFISMILLSLIGAVLGTGLLFVVSLIAKGGLGMGDVKLFGAIGLMMGFYGMYNTLFYAAAFITLFVIGGLVLKKMNRKSHIPFGPFVFIGYIAVILMGAF
ncbi:MAG: prepilin peptidase [Lachnospiraceae bacterium]|nr:prepilin peptidase [Lachnospiraceae bacterium]